jgi:hypothetical protein
MMRELSVRKRHAIKSQFQTLDTSSLTAYYKSK